MRSKLTEGPTAHLRNALQMLVGARMEAEESDSKVAMLKLEDVQALERRVSKALKGCEQATLTLTEAECTCQDTMSEAARLIR